MIINKQSYRDTERELQVRGGLGVRPQNRSPYFFVAVPSTAVIQFVPSCDISYFRV
jgi:hypothetical protein